MAKDEKKPDAKADAKAAPEAPAPKKGGMKMIGAVGVVVVAQVLITAGAFIMLGPKKTVAKVDEHALVKDDSASSVEITIIPDKDGKFPNMMSGSLWVWSAEIVVQVKQRNVEAVENTLAQRQAEIKEEVARIFARAQLSQLKEPERQTLNRQLNGVLTKIFGTDEKGESLIDRVLIPRCIGAQL
ncbi:MAG: hypothetical protein K2X32_14820 [Phycisphaerales bacterium]|nr:hypothetical protein [Phycisphaerales bacterium]